MDSQEQIDRENADEDREPRWYDHGLRFIRSIEGITFVVTILLLIAVLILFAQSRAASKDNRDILHNLQDCIDGTGSCGAANDEATNAAFQFIVASDFCTQEVPDPDDVSEFVACVARIAPTVELPK